MLSDLHNIGHRRGYTESTTHVMRSPTAGFLLSPSCTDPVGKKYQHTHLFTVHMSSSCFEPVGLHIPLMYRPITTRVTLSNLRWLGFRGANAYLEALLPGVTIRLLGKIQVYFINQLTYSIPHLQQSTNSAGNLRPKTVALAFSNGYFHVGAFPHKWARMFSLYMELSGRHLDWQVASAAQVFRSLRTVFSAVERLTIHHDGHTVSSGWNVEAHRTQWHELLRCLNNVKTFAWATREVTVLSSNSLVLYNLTKEDQLPCYPRCRSSHISRHSFFPTHSPRNIGHSLRNGSFLRRNFWLRCVAKCCSNCRTTAHAPANFNFPTHNLITIRPSPVLCDVVFPQFGASAVVTPWSDLFWAMRVFTHLDSSEHPSDFIRFHRPGIRFRALEFDIRARTTLLVMNLTTQLTCRKSL